MLAEFLAVALGQDQLKLTVVRRCRPAQYVRVQRAQVFDRQVNGFRNHAEVGRFIDLHALGFERGFRSDIEAVFFGILADDRQGQDVRDVIDRFFR